MAQRTLNEPRNVEDIGVAKRLRELSLQSCHEFTSCSRCNRLALHCLSELARAGSVLIKVFSWRSKVMRCSVSWNLANAAVCWQSWGINACRMKPNSLGP
jgi:hypothetical protein